MKKVLLKPPKCPKSSRTRTVSHSSQEQQDEFDFKLETFEEQLSKIPDYPHLTKELEEGAATGHFDLNTLQLQTKTRECQEIERQWLLEVYDHKEDLKASCDSFSRLEMMMLLSDPKEVMELSMETLIKLLETVKGRKIETFDDVLLFMDGIQGVDISKVVQEENIRSGNNGFEEDDMFPEGTPMKAANDIKKNLQNRVFPSSHDMLRKNACMTPAPVFQFGNLIPPSTNKTARFLKPGEAAFSLSGSPLLLPKLPNKRNAETIPVNDADGKRITEIVMYKGEEDKRKEFKELVTDIRGVIATKSIKQDRIRSRMVKGPPSASKKPTWL